MFESAEIGHHVKKSEFSKAVPVLRRALLDAQYKLLEKPDFPVIILVNGVDGAGKGETVNLLNEWMDPRHIQTHAFGPPNDIEGKHPEMWRFWQVLPPKGKMGIMFGSWYTDPILQRVLGAQDEARFQQILSRIRDHERMLVAEGALIIKFWFHLSKAAQKKRLEDLSKKKSTAWRVSPQDWEHFKHYDEFVGISETALRESSTGEAPWHVIEGSDHAYRSLTAGRILLDGLERRLADAGPPVPVHEPLAQASVDQRNLLNSSDYSRKLDSRTYERKLEKLQGDFNLLTRHKKMRERSLVMVFEGMDAAGKGSTIRRITVSMDARFYQVVPIAAPTEEERAQPYLWRFWRHVPAQGNAVIFDRSWYGRVLVERVEEFCRESDWMRAYHEINEFEEQLASGGAIVAKFWLAISPEEQLRRFKERADTPHKQFKITEEDWRNRNKWPDYERAVADMIDRTSTRHAPWLLVASDDKPWSRVETLERLVGTIEAAL
jgi:polyphosphate:AMP phosphotransferase